jgi:hypothetical protein
METVDLLTMAVIAARMLRRAGDPEAVLAGAYAVLEQRPPPDQGDDLAVRVARLMVAAGANRPDVLDFIRQNGHGLLNRPLADDAGPDEGAGPTGADPEALRLQELVNDEEGLQGRSMFDDRFPQFHVAGRSVSGSFGGRTVILRDGRRLTPEEAGELQADDGFACEPEGLPLTVRGLIDYPVEVPVLFQIETGRDPWSLWEICCAFADQYAKIYEQPKRYGVWGHDLNDLWIEGLVYYPKEQLIYPLMGS